MENKKWLLAFIPMLIFIFLSSSYENEKDKKYHLIDRGFCDLYNLLHENHKELMQKLDDIKYEISNIETKLN